MHTLSYTAAPDITRIIRNHAARYPESEPQDVVKLLYQSVFGPGHLVSDPNAAAERLLHELKNSPSRESVFNDEIGGGFARLHLIPGTDPDYALFAFLKSARSVGSSHELLKAFETLYHLSGEDALTFDTQSLNRYLDDYRAAGCPMVSHSAAYRGAYAPSYRVVHREFVLLEPLIRKIRSLTSEKDHTVVVLDGFCASGKSTLAYFLQEIFAARLIHMDDFFLPPEKRTPERFAQPGGNVDYERFRTEVIEHLAEESIK